MSLKRVLYGAMPSDAGVGMQKGSLWHTLLLECVWKLEVGSQYRLSSTHVSVASLARESPNLNSSWLSEFAIASFTRFDWLKEIPIDKGS